MNAQRIAREIKDNPAHMMAIDAYRKYSHANAKTFLEEQVGQDTMSLSITNPTTSDIKVVIGSLMNSQFANKADLMEAVGGDEFLADGIIRAGATADQNIVATSNDSARKINDALRYMANSPTRFTDLSMISTLVNGQPDSTNFSTQLKSVFVSPWKKPVDAYLNLRKTQSNRANSPQFAHVNFIEEGWKALVSNENFIVLTVKAGTKLDCTWSIGKQYSKAQEFYRGVKAADDLTLRLSKIAPQEESCNC